MILLAGVMIVRVAAGTAQPVFLSFPVFFMLRARWACCVCCAGPGLLTLAAVALSAGSFLWSFTTQHIAVSLLQGLLNLVFFLYLVRTDVRKNLHSAPVHIGGVDGAAGAKSVENLGHRTGRSSVCGGPGSQTPPGIQVFWV